MADYQQLTENGVIRKSDGANIPNDDDNVDWKSYQLWLAVGNTPDPAPQPSANEVLVSQIQSLEATVTERRVREAVLGVDNGWLKNLNDQIAALRAQLTKE